MEQSIGNDSALIGSDRVEGTSVFGSGREKIGTIERVMIEKESGVVAYAVMRYGGVLGFGDEHYPLPWRSLAYDTTLGGYRVDLTEDELRKAPHDEAEVGEHRAGAVARDASKTR